MPLKADSNKNKVKNHFDFCCNKIMKLDMNNVISTTKPPANAQEPGYSPITSQIRIGARILSPKIRRATSALGIFMSKESKSILPTIHILTRSGNRSQSFFHLKQSN